MPHPKLAALSAQLESAAVTGSDGVRAVGYGTFLRIVLGVFKERIDTEEERDALIDAALLLADKLVAGRFPLVWPVVRFGLRETLDEAGDKLPELLSA